MTNEEIKEYISSLAPAATYDETGEWLNIIVDPTALKPLMADLRTGKMQMNYLFCLTCVDVKTDLTMVYHLSATTHRQSIVIKANVNTENFSGGVIAKSVTIVANTEPSVTEVVIKAKVK